MTATEQRQIEREANMVRRGIERYWDGIASAEATVARRGTDAPTRRLLKEAVEAVAPSIVRIQDVARAKVEAGATTGRRLGGWELPVAMCSPDTMAYIAVRCLLLRGEGSTVQAAAQSVGSIVALQLETDAISRMDADADRPDRMAKMRSRLKHINPKSIRKWLRTCDDIERGMLTKPEQFQVGLALLSCVIEALPEWFSKVTVPEPGFANKTKTWVGPTVEFIELVQSERDYAAIQRPWWQPMLVAPKPWESKDSGGYLAVRNPGLGQPRRHDAREGAVSFAWTKDDHLYDHKMDPSPETVAALNTVQSTAWRVNRDVLAVAAEAVEDAKGPVPFARFRTMPDAVEPEVWEAMSDSQRGAHKQARAAVHTHNNRAKARYAQACRTLDGAIEDQHEPVLYFPHNMDWRGRAYPLPTDLQPQGDDFARGLLTFAEAKPLGKRGLHWLLCHAANVYGLDKEDRFTQEAWAYMHMDRIHAIAEAPFENLDFWTAAAEPWQFLAAAIEVTRAFKSGDPEAYECSLPVSIDGTCNGLQHLSAMGLDPVGGKAVNLLPGARQDIYQDVADAVNEALDPGSSWAGKVDRKVVKRGVMTVPYGLTKVGMRDQLIRDGMVEGVDGDRMSNANELRDLMWDAIEHTLVGGTAIMCWLQQCSIALAKKNSGISWTTPAGNRITQSYTKRPMKRLDTPFGRVYVGVYHERDEKGRWLVHGGKKEKQVTVSKAGLSIAPNVVHSFDAAHMMLTVNTLADQGMSFAMVHDSYGTHACDMDTLAEATRSTFVRIYSENQLERLAADFAFEQDTLAVDVTAIEPPERGSLEITQVLDSPWFFA
jgi:DNA-directed RNA polymerase